MKTREAVEVARILAMRRRALANRTEIISLRVTPEEKIMLQRTASNIGETLSVFVRESAIDVARALNEFDNAQPK